MMRSESYFDVPEDAPPPVSVSIGRRLRFSDADPLGIAWHGNYPRFFEEAQTELGHRCGLTYAAYRASGIAAPIARIHIDYRESLYLDECFTVTASLIWNDGARLNTEYGIVSADGRRICRGFTVQMFVELESRKPLWLNPPLWEECRARWRRGEFHDA